MKVTVESAVNLTPDQRKKLTKKLESILGLDLEIRFHTDAKLLAGLRIVADEKTVDMSLSAKFSQLKQSLLA